MDDPELLKNWYESDHNQDQPCSLVDKAFQAAVERFTSDMTKDKRKITTAESATCLEEVQGIVAESMAKYESDRKHWKAKRWLHSMAGKLEYYQNVMDMLVQHHPEYVALAWGAMKFLLLAVLNHGRVIACLAKALSQIADVLPRVKLATILYPTDKMKVAVEELYAHLLRFFIRANDWYRASTISHIVHSFTRPVELRYKDLVETIAEYSRRIDNLALSGSQAELRDMHKKLDRTLSILERSGDVHSMLSEMRAMMISFQSLNSSALLDTNQSLTDVQFSQIMDFLSKVAISDPITSQQYYLFMRRRRMRNNRRKIPDSFTVPPKLEEWSASDASALAILKGNYGSRVAVRDFCVERIEQLRSANSPVLWALRANGDRETLQNISSIDLLKYLILQALRHNPSFKTEKAMALSYARFQNAATEKEWFQVLETVLVGLGHQTYIIIDLGILDSILEPIEDFSWLFAFLDFFRGLKDRGMQAVVKVLFFSYGTLIPPYIAQGDTSDFTIPIKISAARGLPKPIHRSAKMKHRKQNVIL